MRLSTGGRPLAQLNAETKVLRFERGKMEEMDLVFKTSSIPLPRKVVTHAAGSSGAGAEVNWRSGDEWLNQWLPFTCQNVLE